MDEVWKVVAGAVAALVVGALLHLLKEGGVRRTRRRNITEELELVALLGEHPEPAARIRKRVEVMLQQYEPDDAAVATRRQRWQRLLEFVVLAVVAVFALSAFEVSSWWGSALVGAVVALAGNLGLWIAGRRRDQAEQDEAVHSVRADLAGEGTLSAAAYAVPPEESEAKTFNL